MNNSTYILLEKNITIPNNTSIQNNINEEPIFSTACANTTLPSASPPIFIVSCNEPILLPEVEPLRSTFCFPGSTFLFQSHSDILQLKTQWDTFEKVENYNSIVLNNLANTVPQENNSINDNSIFYQFESSEEKTNYTMGQLYHTAIYPDVVDFRKPYASRPIPYTSAVLSTIKKQNYDPDTSSLTVCKNVLPPPPLDSDIILNNRLGLNIYVRVSTQNAQFPKSPYKFTSNQEYITYMNYKNSFC